MSKVKERIEKYLALAEAATVINHVKWRKAHDAGLIYPAADTDLFESLTSKDRGTLVFIPAEKDYPAAKADLSRTEGEWAAKMLLRAIEALEKVALSTPDSEMEFELCGCDESSCWMNAARKRKSLAREFLKEMEGEPHESV